MLTRLLGLVFNRWTLLLLLLLAALLSIWVVGPLISIGEARPLDSERSRWIAVSVVLLATVLNIGWRRWRARRGNAQVVQQLAAPPVGAAKASESADLAAVRERFAAAMQVLRHARFGGPSSGVAGLWHRLGERLGGRYLYQMPWYLIIGAPGTGKTTALRNAGLKFPLAARMGEQAIRGVGGTRNCDWWFTDRAVLIDTAGRFTTQDSDVANDKATWDGFLSLLKRSRPRQPLNGVLVTVAASDLITKNAADRHAHAMTVRARLQELHERLGIRLPIYLLVTKCDLMAGFGETFAALDKEQRATPWGFTFALQDKASPGGLPFQTALAPEFDALLQRLSIGTVDRLQAESDPQRRVLIYGFANQFANLRGPLLELVQEAFAPSPFEADPMLRGVYFVSGTQEGSPIDRVLGGFGRRYHLEQAMLPSQHGSGRSYFLERLLTEVVFAEQGLAATNRRWERRRGILALAGYAAVAVLGVTTVSLWAWSWRNNKAYIETVASRVDSVRRQVQETPNRATPELLPVLGALEATHALAAAGDVGAQVPTSLGFGLYQGRKLDSAAQAAYEHMLVDSVLPRLALRVEEQLRAIDQPESHYEALKAYLMMYDPSHFDAASLKAHIEADWDARLGRSLLPEQRETLSRHLDALLAQGAAVSPLPQDKPLIDATRLRLAAVSLPQRVYNRLRQTGLGDEFPEFTVVRAGGGNAPQVFTRTSGRPLTRGVPGLFTYDGYHKGFQVTVDKAARQLADEQGWVLGITASKSAESLLTSGGRLVDDVRRLYLTEYRDTWKDFIADVRLAPIGTISQALERTRFLAAPDTPLLPLLRSMSRETTLLAGHGLLGGLTQKAQSTSDKFKEAVRGAVDMKPPAKGAPGERLESIVDDEFAGLRRMVTAPEGGKAPIEGVIARLGELQVHLTAVEAALKGGGAPQPSPLPNQLKAEAANAPEPVRSMLDNLGATSARVGLMQLRESLSREVKAQIGDFCNQAVTGRYPFDGSSARDVTLADFATLFGPGGKFDQLQQRLGPYIDTSTRTWSFRAIEGTPLGTDVGTLPQFQRAAVIRETFFSGGAGPSTQLSFKPVEMDTQLREFTLDVDGQIVRYDHGPQIPQPIKWPGPRGTGVVRVMVNPAGSTGMVNDGPWALYRLFDRVVVTPGAAPEKFRATFDIDGRKVVFDVTAGSVRHPFRMTELKSFTCPNGL